VGYGAGAMPPPSDYCLSLRAVDDVFSP
jgi:hypothetical protein